MKAILILLALSLSFNVFAQSSNETCPLATKEISYLKRHLMDGIDTAPELLNILGLTVLYLNKNYVYYLESNYVKSAVRVLMFSIILGRLISYFTGAREYFNYFFLANYFFVFISRIPNVYEGLNFMTPRVLLPTRYLSAEQPAVIPRWLMARILEGPGILENTVCSICLDNYVPVGAISHLDCEHDFHTNCLKQWAETLPQYLCPLCRK